MIKNINFSYDMQNAKQVRTQSIKSQNYNETTTPYKKGKQKT